MHRVNDRYLFIFLSQLRLCNVFLLFRYLYTDSLQGYKYALDDIVLHYKSEIGKVLDPDLREYVIKYIQRFGSDKSLMEQIMKEQLRIYLQRREMFEVPFIQGMGSSGGS